MASRRGASEGLAVRGVSTLRAWRAGVIPRLLKAGCNLTAARIRARHAGALVTQQAAPNLITAAGKALVGDLLVDVVDAGLSYHALGTSAQAPSPLQQILSFEVVRKAFTLRTRAANVATFSVFYLASESTYHIREVGVFGGPGASLTPSSGVLFSRLLQTFDNSDGEFDLTFDYDLTIG